MNTWILYLVIASHPSGLTSLSQEHISRESCIAAKDNVRQLLSGDAKIVLATCVPK